MSESSCSTIDCTDTYQNELFDDLIKEETYFELKDNSTLDSDIDIVGLSDEDLCSPQLESSINHKHIGKVKEKHELHVYFLLINIHCLQ
jgi:hypothetical protein